MLRGEYLSDALRGRCNLQYCVDTRTNTSSGLLLAPSSLRRWQTGGSGSEVLLPLSVEVRQQHSVCQ